MKYYAALLEDNVEEAGKLEQKIVYILGYKLQLRLQVRLYRASNLY